MAIPTIPLRDGHQVPILAFGSGTAWFKTALGNIDRAQVEATKAAIARGFTHLDCAEMYGSERETGVAIAESGVPREAVFVTHKVSRSYHDIRGAATRSLRAMGLDYFDLYLLHDPFWAKSEADLQRAWREMEELQAAGLTRSIGVSNFLRPQLEAILATAKSPPVLNQIEYHAYLQHRVPGEPEAESLVPWMQAHGIVVGSYKGLAPVAFEPDGPLRDPLARIAAAHGVSPTVVCLAWVKQQSMVAVTTTRRPERLDEYARVVEVTLSPEEMATISAVGATHHKRWHWGKYFGPDDRR